MAERNENRTEVENRESSMLSQALEEELGEIPEASITIEELRELEQMDRKKKRIRKAKIIGTAAALLIVCGVAAYAACWPEAAVPVDAAKNQKQSVTEENGMVIINEGDAEGEGAVTTIETDCEKVQGMRNSFPDLIIPAYVPKGYKFVELEIEQYTKSGYVAMYRYEKDAYILELEARMYQEAGNALSVLSGEEEKVKTDMGTAYILEGRDNSDLLMINIFSKQMCLKVTGKITREEGVEIINKIDMP